MIVSCSRRTDIPAFYTPWLMNRIAAGYCRVPNPFNPHQISRVALTPDAVDAIVFWTRHPEPLLPCLDTLDAMGFRYYFLYTLMDNPTLLDPNLPPLAQRIDVFRRLASRLGLDRVIWRYDPVVISNITDGAFHLQTFERLSAALEGWTRQVIVSFVDLYPGVKRRLAPLAKQGVRIAVPDDGLVADLIPAMTAVARDRGMTMKSCAEKRDLARFGVPPGRCIDDGLLRRLFGIVVPGGRDAGQRKRCRCVKSRDIGVYGTCRFGCRYCYAASGDGRRQASRRHDPSGECLVPLTPGFRVPTETASDPLFEKKP